jgi:hypothetical protein
MLGGLLGTKGAAGAAAMTPIWLSSVLGPVATGGALFAGTLGLAQLSRGIDLGKMLDNMDVSDFTMKLQEKVKTAFDDLKKSLASGGWAAVGQSIVDGLLSGLQAAAGGFMNWATSFIAELKALFSFSASPSITPHVNGAPGAIGDPGGGTSPIPQHYIAPVGGGAKMQHASMQIHGISIHVNGAGDPKKVADAVWDKFHASVHRQLSDGAYA